MWKSLKFKQYTCKNYINTTSNIDIMLKRIRYVYTDYTVFNILDYILSLGSWILITKMR